MPGFSKRLVVDACVARASGGEVATHPTSKQCRDFLQTILDVSHRIVLTPDIRVEWTKHQSSFARRWLVAMQQKGKIVRINIDTDSELHSKMRIYAESNSLSVDEVLKDLHLVEAAFEADEVIVSYENYSRRHYSNAAKEQVPEMARIAWINPCNESEESLTWLKSGAKTEEHRRLSFDG